MLNVRAEILRYLFVVAATLSLFAVAYAVASAPSRVASRLGLRGLKRQRALAQNEMWAQVEPLVRWFGVRVSGLLSDTTRDAIDRQIGLAGDFLGMSSEEYVGLSILSSLGGFAVGALFGYLTDVGGVLVVAIGALGGALPYLAVSGEAQRRLKEVGRRLPYAIDLLALAMSAGLDFPGAVRQVVEKSCAANDPLVEEFTLILQELSLGKTRKQALADFARRVPTDSVIEFVGAVTQAEERGNPVADVLQIQAHMSRQRRSVRAEEAATKAGVALVGPLMLIFLCILILLVGPMVIQLARSNV